MADTITKTPIPNSKESALPEDVFSQEDELNNSDLSTEGPIPQESSEPFIPQGEALKNTQVEKTTDSSSQQKASNIIDPAAQNSQDDAQADNIPATTPVTNDELIFKTFEDLLKILNTGVSKTTELARKVFAAFLQAREP